jgi:hypothetical protein
MEQHAFKNVSNCLNNNIYSYLETPGGVFATLHFPRNLRTFPIS